MNATLARVLSVLARGPAASSRPLDGFVDSLLQSFENCRPGLSDAMEGASGESADAFFTRIYEKEIPRLKDQIRLEETLLSREAREELFRKVDDLVRSVVLPAYVRLAERFTRRERNAFYLAPESLHGLERLGWGLAGTLIGAFVVWAPFIPIWSKDLILPCAAAGLVFPNLRRLLMVRRYERELNRLVAHTDAEIDRIDRHYLTAPVAGEDAGERLAAHEDARAAVPRRLAAHEGQEPPA